MSEERSKCVSQAPFVGSEFADEDFEQVREILLQSRGFDLGMYKDRCVKRRIAGRVRALGFSTAAPYVSALRRSEAEIDTLLAALTIHVSQFFRNPSTFAMLERRILPELVERAGSGGRRRIRLWSVGCASGEEPYSLALLADDLDAAGVDVQILATDVSAPILGRAREALFDPQRLLEVPATVRERYFEPEGKNFRLRADIRAMVRFERHNILSGPEYPEADLILCRNVLIYFSRAEQEKILARFSRALPLGGFLVLGRAETLLGSVRRRFEAECPEERIYRRRQD